MNINAHLGISVNALVKLLIDRPENTIVQTEIYFHKLAQAKKLKGITNVLSV